MKYIYIFVLVCACSIHAIAQSESGYNPVVYDKGYVYLKDGSVLKGKYVYSSSLDKIRVVSGKNSWVFDSDQVLRTTKSKPPRILGNETAKKEIPEFTIPLSKWFNLTEIGVIAGNKENRRPTPFVFGTSMNRIIRGNLSAGMGIGAEFLTETYMPVSLNLMYRLRNNPVTPFAMLQGGYQIPVEDTRTYYQNVVPNWVSYLNPVQELKAGGGLFINPSFGILKNYNQGFGISLAFGYRFHRLHYTGEDNYRFDADFNRLSLKLGFIFN